MYRESIPREENPGASLLGQTIDPAYRLTSLLDSSGTCDVYRAWDHSDDRYVVVKLLRLRCEPPVLERITKHIRSLCYEAFPHVVPVLAHGIHQGYPYVILPYLAGGTLRQRRPTENHRALLAHPALLFTWLPRIAAALDSLHDHGMNHGAVSPDTILFDHAGDAWLADRFPNGLFGMTASEATREGETREPPQHPAYLSPQRLQGMPASSECDQYALAAVVFDYLAGRPPFEGATAEAVAAAQHQCGTPLLQHISPNLPHSLAVATRRALDRDPAVRFATCGDFVSRALADVRVIDVPRKLRLICPSCQVLVAVLPETAGRQGRCQACQAEIEIDADSRWLARASDRRATIPAAPVPSRYRAPPGHRVPAGLAALVGTLALVLLAIRRPGPLPSGPPVVAAALEPVSLEPPTDPADVAAGIPAPAPAEEPDNPFDDPQDPSAVLPPAQMLPGQEPSALVPPALVPPAELKPDSLPAVVAEVPAIAPRPAARDLTLDIVKRDLESLHVSRKRLVANRDSLAATILEQQTILKGLRGDEATKRQRLTEQQLLFQTLSIQNAVLPSPVVLRQLASVESEIILLREQLLTFDDARSGAQSALASAQRELDSVLHNGESLRQNWIARLSPLDRDATLDTRIRVLSDEIIASPDFPECRLYRALLHILAGNVDDARDDLAIVERTLLNGEQPVPSSTAIDFVYASLMLGDGTAARGCLAVAQRHIPNDPVLQHIQALCEMAENDFSKAAMLLRAALQKTSRGTRRDRTLLCSDAAWLFAAAPSDLVRNPKLAEELATEAIDSRSGKAWQAWRARAVLQADADQWADAEQSLLNAQKTAPLILAEEIALQMQAVANHETYRIPRRAH